MFSLEKNVTIFNCFIDFISWYVKSIFTNLQTKIILANTSVLHLEFEILIKKQTEHPKTFKKHLKFH